MSHQPSQEQAGEASRLYTLIRKNVEKRYEMRTSFFGDLAGFVIMNVLFWLVWIGPEAVFAGSAIREYWLASLITAVWGLGLAVHFINWFFTELREDEIRREMDRYGLSLLAAPPDVREAEKAKRLVRLTEDGELEEIDSLMDDPDDEDDQRRPRARRVAP